MLDRVEIIEGVLSDERVDMLSSRQLAERIDAALSTEDERYTKFVHWTREQVIHPMMESAFVTHLLPGGEPDVKVCVEIGAAMLLDKPILAVATPGRSVPENMRRVAAEIVEVDVDTADGQAALQAAITRMLDATT